MNLTTGGVPCSVHGDSAGSLAGLKVPCARKRSRTVMAIRNKAIR
jgi:hypothetical protein